LASATDLRASAAAAGVGHVLGLACVLALTCATGWAGAAGDEAVAEELWPHAATPTAAARIPAPRNPARTGFAIVIFMTQQDADIA
jgi:hypothetical protein